MGVLGFGAYVQPVLYPQVTDRVFYKAMVIGSVIPVLVVFLISLRVLGRRQAALRAPLLYALMATLLVLAGTIAGALSTFNSLEPRGHDVAARPVRARGHRCRPSRRLRDARATGARRSGAAASPSWRPRRSASCSSCASLLMAGGNLFAGLLDQPAGRDELRRSRRHRLLQRLRRGGRDRGRDPHDRRHPASRSRASPRVSSRATTRGKATRSSGRPRRRRPTAISRRRCPRSRPTARCSTCAKRAERGGVMSTPMMALPAAPTPPRPRLLMVATSLAVAAGTMLFGGVPRRLPRDARRRWRHDCRLGAVVDHVPDDHRERGRHHPRRLSGRHPLGALVDRERRPSQLVHRARPHRGARVRRAERDGVLVQPDAPRRQRQRLLRHGRHDRRSVPRPAGVRHGVHRV